MCYYSPQAEIDVGLKVIWIKNAKLWDKEPLNPSFQGSGYR